MPKNEKIESAMSSIFDIENVLEETKELSVTEPFQKEEQTEPISIELETDFEQSRKNLNKLIAETTPVLTDLINLAKETESARVYEVVATLVKTLSEINKDVLSLHDLRKKILSNPNKSGKQFHDTRDMGSNINVDKAVFVGTTAAFNKMIKNGKSDDE